ncbi:hypothetical protein EDB83DRAFT_2417605 [Lactarius deliciosus]|nr:hypothetical protein EDB83DRAFT_2417605 [Lactarius deliciosus]
MAKTCFFLSLRLSSLSEVFLFLSAFSLRQAGSCQCLLSVLCCVRLASSQLCPCLSTSSVRVGCQCGSMDVLVGFQWHVRRIRVSEWQTVPRYITQDITISTRHGEAHVRIFPTRASLD